MAIQTLHINPYNLAYQYYPIQDKPCVLFLPGYYSDMSGTKAVYLRDYCQQQELGFLSLDYRGHGQSDGQFIDYGLSDWLQDCLDVIDHTKAKDLIVVGSSMGGWLMLLLQRLIPEKIKGLIGIAAAPDFTDQLIWSNLTALQKETIRKAGHLILPSQYNAGGTPLSLRFIEDARQHLLLDKDTLNCPFPMRLLHGLKDEDVPYSHAEKIIRLASSGDAQIILIKNGDHRLNEPAYLNHLGYFVKELSLK